MAVALQFHRKFRRKSIEDLLYPAHPEDRTYKNTGNAKGKRMISCGQATLCVCSSQILDVL